MRDIRNLLKEFSIPLIFGVVLALVMANYDYHLYHYILETPFFGTVTPHFLINDIFMVFFFAIAAVEVTQSVLPGGDLSPVKKAVTPLVATLGGILGPITVFFVLNAVLGKPEYINGWGITTATDIAISWLVAKAIFGKNHPAVKFLLLLAIVDDAVGLLIIAVFYQESASVQPVWLILVLAGVIVAFLLRRFNVNNFWPYIIFGGGLSWFGLHQTGVHPALALVFIVPFLPHWNQNKTELFDYETEERSPLANFEHKWKDFVEYGLFFFGFANAGVKISGASMLTVIIFLSLFLGKTLGIFSFTVVARKLGLRLPNAIEKKDVLMLSVIAGIGLTVSLFIASVAFLGNEALTDAAKMGALASGLVAFLSLVLGKILKIKKIK